MQILHTSPTIEATCAQTNPKTSLLQNLKINVMNSKLMKRVIKCLTFC